MSFEPRVVGAYQLELSCLQLSFLAYSPLRCCLDTLSHCKQRSSTGSKKGVGPFYLRVSLF